MIHKILNFLRIVPIKQLRKIEESKDFLYNENLKLRSENKVLRGVEFPHVPVDAEDPDPIDSEQRKLYVARVAGFYHDIFEKKIISIISENRNELSKLRNTRDFDIYLKATENALWLVRDWGKAMIAEHMENQRGITPSEVDELKAKIIKT